MVRHSTSSWIPKPDTGLTKMPPEVLQIIFRTLFEEATIYLKRPHDMCPARLTRLFPILAVDARLHAEGIDVLSRYAALEIEDLTNFPFPHDGPALRMLQEFRHLSLQKHQLVTFQLSRQFPQDALRSSRRCFENLQHIDIVVASTLQPSDFVTQLSSHAALMMIDLLWRSPDELEAYEIFSDYSTNDLVEFIKAFQRKYKIVLKMEFWIAGRLRCEAAMSNGVVTEIVVENKGRWWNERFWRNALAKSWEHEVGIQPCR